MDTFTTGYTLFYLTLGILILAGVILGYTMIRFGTPGTGITPRKKR